MMAPPAWVSDSGLTVSPGTATIATAWVVVSKTTPVNVSTAMAMASNNQRVGVLSCQRIVSSPTSNVKNWKPTSR
jgi:hypothetical protein